MSFPRSVNLFIPWSKAMVAGATVDKPNYGKGMSQQGKGMAPNKLKRRRRRKRRKARQHHGSKD